MPPKIGPAFLPRSDSSSTSGRYSSQFLNSGLNLFCCCSSFNLLEMALDEEESGTTGSGSGTGTRRCRCRDLDNPWHSEGNEMIRKNTNKNTNNKDEKLLLAAAESEWARGQESRLRPVFMLGLNNREGGRKGTNFTIFWVSFSPSFF